MDCRNTICGSFFVLCILGTCVEGFSGESIFLKEGDKMWHKDDARKDRLNWSVSFFVMNNRKQK